MRIQAETVRTHRFLTGRRGYLVDEVDKVMARIATTLDDQEQEIADLGTKLSEARETEEAMRAMLLAAQRAKDDILAEANADAERVLADAAAEAERIVDEAGVTAEEVRAQGKRDLSEMMLSIAEARDLADTRAQEAAEAAERVLGDARIEADRVIGDAHIEAGELVERLPRLRTAVRDIEIHLESMAKVALERVEVANTLIDLTAEEAAAVIETPAEAGLHLVPEPTAAPFGSGAPPAARPVTSAAPSPPPMPTEGTTRYQRRGAGLRSRIEESREEG